MRLVRIKQIVRQDIWEKKEEETFLTEEARVTVQQHAGTEIAFPAIGTVFNVTSTDVHFFHAEQIGPVLFIPLSAPKWAEEALRQRFQVGN